MAVKSKILLNPNTHELPPFTPHIRVDLLYLGGAERDAHELPPLTPHIRVDLLYLGGTERDAHELPPLTPLVGISTLSISLCCGQGSKQLKVILKIWI